MNNITLKDVLKYIEESDEENRQLIKRHIEFLEPSYEPFTPEAPKFLPTQRSVRRGLDDVVPVETSKISTLKVGDKVRLNSKANPKYIRGSTATIKKINHTRVVLDLDIPQGRFDKNINCPVSILDLI